MNRQIDLRRNHLRVAALSTAVVAIVYILLVAVVDLIAIENVHREIDDLLQRQLAFYQSHPRALGEPIQLSPDSDVTFDAPPLVWVIDTSVTPPQVIAATEGAPTLPSNLYGVTSPQTVQISGAQMVVLGGAWQGDWVVVGQRANFVNRTNAALFGAEAIAILPLLLFVFGGAFLISRRAVAPVEAARRRQLEFAADASHELRTPLAVIEAETSLALQKSRTATSYKATLERISQESERLRRLVDDLLWLARMDAEPTPPRADIVDIGSQAQAAVARFSAVAQRRSQTITATIQPGALWLVSAPVDWIEHLLSVLVDNACRYSPDGGSINVSVQGADGRVRLVVDDSGPGIPPAERTLVFDRFHRATDTAGGAGLGLAIGDAVVGSTGGRWELGDSPLGGARVAVSWPAIREIPQSGLQQPGPSSEPA